MSIIEQRFARRGTRGRERSFRLGTRGIRCALIALVGSVAWLLPAAASASTPTAPLQPIAIQRINLPKGITSAGWPVFAHDGQHLLFFSTAKTSANGSIGSGSTAQLWIVGRDGSDPHCLSCGLANDPSSEGEGEITPFPDGKRVFFGAFYQPGGSGYGILDCEPSLVDCTHSSISRVDFTPAETSVVPAGGAAAVPETDLGGAYAAKLSPDGKSVGFSDIRTDSIETMVIGKLVQSGATYQVTDPQVINPAGPSSPLDTSIDDWSNGGALYEFKTFTHGGADATYVQVGGEALQNPDVWSVNLATGIRTRVTANADYDEDNAVSPNGQLLAVWSNRTEHLTDWLGGLLPVRDFIDEPSAVLATSISSSNKRCHGPMWVLPGNGDDGGQIVGEPIIYDKVKNIFVTNNQVGWPQWSPDGTMLALNTTNGTPGSGYPAHAPFLLVAHFTALKPSKPLAVVSSQPGAWAPSPSNYHPDFGFTGDVTLNGPGGGTVTLSYAPTNGVLAGAWSETYDNYSDNGRDVVNGTVSISGSVSAGTLKENLTMTGADTGNDRVDITLGADGSGSGESTYDGHTVSGPSVEQAAKSDCPKLYPKEPALRVTATRRANGAYRLKVTVSQANGGANEATTTIQPVTDATITLGGVSTHTNAAGLATITPRRSGRVTVTAGDTLVPTSIYLTRR